jgi:D-alanyl-D-alanine dipeptidase
MYIEEAESVIDNDLIERSKKSYRKVAATLPVSDNQEPLVKLHATNNILLQPFWSTPGDLEGDLYHPYIEKNRDFTLMVRQTVANKLEKASSLLPEDWTMVVKAGLRPLTVQYDLLNTVAKQIKSKTPHLTTEQVLERTRIYVSDPEIICPPHCTGGAVDINIIYRTSNVPVDMGCPPNTNDEIAFTHSSLVSQKQRDNRLLLLNAMFTAGFANLAHEWWHYSYGDQYWAAFYGQPVAIYDIYDI